MIQGAADRHAGRGWGVAVGAGLLAVAAATGPATADALSGDRFETYFISLIGGRSRGLSEPVTFRLYFHRTGDGGDGSVGLDRIVLHGETRPIGGADE